MDLQPVSRHQFTLNLEPEEPASNPNRIQLMHALDSVNGRGTLNLASAVTAGEHRLWKMKQQHKTPGYTTRWEGLAEVR